MIEIIIETILSIAVIVAIFNDDKIYEWEKQQVEKIKAKRH